MDDMRFDVLASSSLAEGEMAGVRAGGKEVALFRVDGKVYATSNICTHQYAVMTDGFLEGGCVECPLHQAVFDVRTGEIMSAPAVTPLRVFPVQEVAGRIWVNIGDGG
jgi:nitrite reductase/ring-hydroxylating ferredoxin subunit